MCSDFTLISQYVTNQSDFRLRVSYATAVAPRSSQDQKHSLQVQIQLRRISRRKRGSSTRNGHRMTAADRTQGAVAWFASRSQGHRIADRASRRTHAQHPYIESPNETRMACPCPARSRSKHCRNPSPRDAKGLPLVMNHSTRSGAWNGPALGVALAFARTLFQRISFGADLPSTRKMPLPTISWNFS